MPSKLFKSSEIKVFNVHPIAYQQQKIMMEELKSLPDYVETEIYHNWERETNTVVWHYAFEDELNTSWKEKVLKIIEMHKQPS